METILHRRTAESGRTVCAARAAHSARQRGLWQEWPDGPRGPGGTPGRPTRGCGKRGRRPSTRGTVSWLVTAGPGDRRAGTECQTPADGVRKCRRGTRGRRRAVANLSPGSRARSATQTPCEVLHEIFTRRLRLVTR